MEKILGIDLGTNSIGWAIRDIAVDGNQIIDKGVLTFEKGVGEDKSGEFPLVQKRTESRGKRRNYQAEKYRKWFLLEALINWGMCPLTIEELDEWRKYKKGIGRSYPQKKEFIEWLRFDFNGDGKPDFEQAGFSKHENHFLFRWLAASEDDSHKILFQTNPFLLGRVFYQLVQRRGFRGRDEEGEEAKAIFNGSEKTGTIGVKALEPFLEKYNTLGSALYHMQKEQGGRIRKRYNLRTDYENELKEICRIQGINEDKYKTLWKAIIWQRPLRSQKGLVGICTFERNKARVAVSHPLYEEFRTWVFINNLKIELPNGLDKENYIKEKIYPLFYKAGRDFKLESIAKELNKVGGEIKARFKPDTKVFSCYLPYRFEKWFGKNWKQELGWKEALNNEPKPCPYSFEDIWHVLNTFDSKEKLKEFAVQKLKLDTANAEDFSKTGLQQGYATLSLSAIKKILPYLQKGYLYSDAVYLANMPKVLGNDTLTSELAQSLSSSIKFLFNENKEDLQTKGIINSLISDQLNSTHRHGMNANYELDEDDKKTILNKIHSTIGAKTWETISEEKRNKILTPVSNDYLDFLRKPITATKEKIFIKPLRFHDKLFRHLQETFGIAEERKKYLWHPSEQESYPVAAEKDGIKILGDPQPISRGFKNPMALKSLHKLKNLLNYLLQVKKIDEDTRVVVEIARELNDTNKRKAIEIWQRQNEKDNDRIKERLKEIVKQSGLNIDPLKKENIEKYKLWEEQNHLCLYTGKTIQCTDLYKGNQFDFEHTIPAKMSFDNELKNLTISDSTYNRQIKGKRIPFELPNYQFDVVIDGEEYSAITPRIKFIEEKVDHFDKELEKQRFFAKVAQTKESKDEAIQKRHVLQFQLDYWRKKLETFTCKEYKAGWRNSQLRDTQIITKYALPYLKTVFKRVDVQKGSVTAAFREIYAIQPRTEKKDRSKHSHHAIDAAVLTLIPSHSKREKILEKYNEMKEISYSQTYHEKPEYWEDFKANDILAIENDVLINFQAQNRTLTPTYKKVRKRGKVQFVKEKLGEGKWRYKLNDKGERIPLIADGDSIRGQLHKESFFGMIKLPELHVVKGKTSPKTDNEGNFIFQFNEKRNDHLFVVKREENLANFTKLDDLETIIDPRLKEYLKKEVSQRLIDGKTFAEAIREPIWAYGVKTDKNGKPISPIRHIRCKVKGGGGGFLNNPSIVKPIGAFISKHHYKRNILAQNGETTLCALYQQTINDKMERKMETYSILDIGILSKENIHSLSQIPSPYVEFISKKTPYLLPLYATLLIGQKVIFYTNAPEDLKAFTSKEINERTYLITKFENDRICFKHHLCALPEDALKSEMKKMGLADTGASAFDSTRLIPKLRLSKSNFDFIVEHIHFNLNLDSTIHFRF